MKSFSASRCHKKIGCWFQNCISSWGGKGYGKSWPTKTGRWDQSFKWIHWLTETKEISPWHWHPWWFPKAWWHCHPSGPASSNFCRALPWECPWWTRDAGKSDLYLFFAWLPEQISVWEGPWLPKRPAHCSGSCTDICRWKARLNHKWNVNLKITPASDLCLFAIPAGIRMLHGMQGYKKTATAWPWPDNAAKDDTIK